MLTASLDVLLSSRQEICIVAHDAGSAQIFKYLPHKPEYRLKFFTDGPAKEILQRIDNFEAASVSDLISSQLVITGTSTTSNLEKNTIKKRLELGKEVWSFLDHWVNYRERFMLQGNLYLPNRILVGDKYALDLALNEFPSEILIETSNPLFDYVRKLDKGYSENYSQNVLLYLWEPLSINLKSSNILYEDIDIFQRFYNVFQKIKPNFKYLIRAHPSKPLPSLIHGLARSSSTVSISNEADILLDLTKVTHVAGFETMGLVLARIMGKEVYSSKPLEFGPLPLALEGIVQI